MTHEDSIQLDRERVLFTDRIMFALGFRHEMASKSYSGPYEFTESILYISGKSGHSVLVFFPHVEQAERGIEITTQASFNNEIESPEWKSLHEFEKEVASWIEECRGRERPHG